MLKITATPEQIQSNNDLIDLAIERAKVKNDAVLSRLMKVAPPVISKIRHGRLAVGSTLMLVIHEVTGMLISDIRRFVPR
ncbi:hypothetical protein [Glaciimonas sp. PCH181]|uniref:hypothetical protein n=1 Tax=Glaciimonas sp. PCH181 TaxID=2133943 RepID=UPI000D36966E|nr:hypothetical protein [Glaciimonas sp. PCH181]PUA19618.1 hypothetical protein C7W93_07170 [Glaciimonas sp. PCH181]